MAAHVSSQPSVIAATADKAFITALQIADRSFSKELIQKYGNERYTDVLDMLGRKQKVENNSFYHYEKTRRLPSAQVASSTGGTSGVDCVATIASGSHFDSGTKSPGRVGEVVQIVGSGVLGKIKTVNTTTPSAHVYTISPLSSTGLFAPANNDHIVFHGAQHVGEGSGKVTSMQPRIEKITNTVTQIREDYEIKDLAAMEKIEFADPKTGKQYFRYLGTSEAEERFLNNKEFLTVFSDEVTNTGITANGTSGTKGLLAQIVSGGSTLSYSAGLMTLDNFQAIGRALTFNGASGEVHVLQDIFQNQEVQRLLFSEFNQGAILWASAGGSKEVAAALGFSSLSMDGFNYHFKKYAPFSPEWAYGIAPTTTPHYRNYSAFLPQGALKSMGGRTEMSVSLQYMEAIPGQELNAYESGGLAMSNKTPDQILVNTIVGHYGVKVAAANQAVIWQG